MSTQCEQDMLDLDGRKSFIKEVDSVAAELQAAGIKLRTHGRPIIPVPMRVAWGLPGELFQPRPVGLLGGGKLKNFEFYPTHGKF